MENIIEKYRGNHIRQMRPEDASRVAEILIFNNRINFFPIFQCEEYSFGELQVVTVAEEYLADSERMAQTYVYDDGILRGMIHICGQEVVKLFVDPFFQNLGIGNKLLQYAIEQFGITWLWALEKNERAIRFYERHDFRVTDEKKLEEDTTEYLVKMVRESENTLIDSAKSIGFEASQGGISDMQALEDSIRREENEFPKRFASYVEKDYGILFYMENNKDSYDGNHACIYPDKINDLGAVLDDIAAFYGKMGMQASIYHPFVSDYFKDNEAILNAHGFSYTPEEDHRVMVLTGENQIDTPKRLDIRLLREWDERIATDILIPSGEPWEVEVTRKRMEQEGSYLFVGYLEDKAVVYTDFHKSDYGNTRFDYIVTAKEHRGKGYAGELLSFVVEYCKKGEFPICWQWAGPSEHICYRAGFREVFSMEGGFASGPRVGG